MPSTYPCPSCSKNPKPGRRKNGKHCLRCKGSGKITYAERNTTVIEKLKNLNVSTYSLEELLELRAMSRLYYDEYKTQKLNPPDWLNNAVVALDGQIHLLVQDELERRLTDAKARRLSLRTPEEKRADLDREIGELEQALGKSAGN